MSAAESPIAEVQHQPAQVEQFTVTAPDGRIIISATRMADRDTTDPVATNFANWAIYIPSLVDTWLGNLALRNSSPDAAERTIGRLAVLLGAEPVGGAR